MKGGGVIHILAERGDRRSRIAERPPPM